jgi:tetratricopeptide (TPR) repeat protein
MPAFTMLLRATGALAVVATSCMLGLAAHAQSATPADKAKSALDAPLFYQLLIGELELRNGQAGNAFEVVLDAARRTKDEVLFRRAADIALEGRAGEQALQASRAWREAVPNSIDAHRYVIQILVALGRANETIEPLQSLITLVPESERNGLIATLPRFFSRASDRKLAPSVLEQVLQKHLGEPATRVMSNVALGRAWLLAGDTARALDHAKRAQALDAQAEGPALLALEMNPLTPAAEALIAAYLQAKPGGNAIRLLYARVLTAAQRYPDAITQLEVATRTEPKLAPPWLSLGALHLELRHPREAEAALLNYVELVQASPAGGKPSAGLDDDDDAVLTPAQGLTQAWLLLSQAADQRGDFAAAESWLAKIDNPQRALEVQTRRASILARQGKVKEARELVRRLPEKTPDDARAKFLAEAQVLRDVKLWAEANAVLASANERFPNDADLLYEQSMMSEKLNRLEEMEKLLRKVIELKPEHHHAYNALGYSLAERNLRLPEAKSLIQKALELVPGEPFITDSLGWVEFRMGNREEALRLLRAAYTARPDTEIGAHLGEVLWVTGQRDEARRILREARNRDANNDVLRETLARLRVDL